MKISPVKHIASALRKAAQQLREAQGAHGSNLLRADFVDGKFYSLAGETTAAGFPRFTITISANGFTTDYQTPSYSQAKREYAKILRGVYPLGTPTAS